MIYEWPPEFIPEEITVGERIQQEFVESPLSGRSQVLTRLGARWLWSFKFPAHYKEDRMRLEGFIKKLSGMEHRVMLFDFHHPQPAGDVNLTGITSSVININATTCSFNGVTPLATIYAGTWFSVGDQLFRTVADSAANNVGVAAIEFRHKSRKLIGSGTPVVLFQPKGMFARASSEVMFPRANGDFAQPDFSLDFVEVW